MNTTHTVMLTGGIVTVGRWQRGQPLSTRVVIGGTFLAIGLATLSNFDADFARLMSYAVLLAALYEYLPALVKAAGFTGAAEKANRTKVGK